MNKLIILAASLDQPRIVKRIIEKSGKYDVVEVFGFKRQIYNVNNYDKLAECNNVKVFIIGSLYDGKYWNRLYLYTKLWLILLFKNPFSKKEIYAFGLDLCLISHLTLNKKVLYEISDIIWLYKARIVKTILMKLDFILCRMSQQVIFTSECFYVMYYNFISSSKIEIIENKFKTYQKVYPLDRLLLDKIRIAYIGAFRYDAIISNLLKYTVKNPSIELSFYGEGRSDIMEVIKEYCKVNKNISYSGYFKNPDDLEKIYSENNINFVAYDNKLDNERVAMPNKFYESGFFNMPIVCSTDTFVGEKVDEMEMGWNINPIFEGISSFFDTLTVQDLQACHERIKKIDKKYFITD
jgi:succinoglycan biosynthesis protein ExoL